MPTDPSVELARDIGGYAFDPVGYAAYAFPWGRAGTSLERDSGPRAWQGDILAIIRDHLRNPQTRYTPLRLAVASGHGIGKSAEIGMISKWALDCWPDARVVITANTEQQLITKTSPEVAKWHRLAITRDWFKIATMKVSSLMEGHTDSWRLDFATWSENNTEAFAGLHNLGRIIVVIYDEGSNIADKVWEVTEGALTDENTVIIWIAFGNPTRNSGRFKECFGRYRHLWIHRQIDSRTVEGTNKEYLQSIVDTYGEGSDIAKVRVLGQFPSASSLQFISSATAQTARTRPVPPELITDPIIFGLDCARYGDDHSTLAIRKGRDARSIPWVRWNDADAMRLAGDVALQAEKWKPDAIFVDAGNIGAAVVDRLRQLGVRNVFEVWFGAKGRDATWSGEHRVRTMNKRAEMWTTMRSWLEGGAIPDEDDLEADMTGVEYGFGPDQTSIQLEKKEHMKARGLGSPDDGDALACTFAEPVLPRETPAHRDPRNWGQGEQYDRYAELGR